MAMLWYLLERWKKIRIVNVILVKSHKVLKFYLHTLEINKLIFIGALYNAKNMRMIIKSV